MGRVLLAGEGWLVQTTYIMGIDSFTQFRYEEGERWLRRAIESGGHSFDHLPSHQAREGFPSSVAAMNEYDLLILSDLGADSLLLHPDTTERSLVTPNRLRVIRDYVHSGGSLLMIGGYLSFSGLNARGRYPGTPVEEVLPVVMSRGVDDRVEIPEGFCAEAPTSSQHPILHSIPCTLPVMLFYNRVTPKPDSTVLFQHEADPILTVWSCRKGRSAAFAADAAPHGATPEFLNWEWFDRLFLQLAEWLMQMR